MNISDIREMPKKIKRKIEELYKWDCYYNGTQYYAYLTTFRKELALVIVAAKGKGRQIFTKQVVVHGIHTDKCFLKDICLHQIGGYTVNWYAEGLSRYPAYYADGEWGWNEDKYFNIFAPIINIAYLQKVDVYKYSHGEVFNSCNLLKYLRLYEKYPQAEYLVKSELKEFALSKQILSKLDKDKAFKKWFIANTHNIYKDASYVSTILYAYKHKMALKDAEDYQSFLKSFLHDPAYPTIKRVFNGNIKRYYEYMKANDINNSSYIDYITACEYLNIDLSQDKNLVPHDFRRWHDIRIDEYNTAKIEQDKKERASFYKLFGEVAKKYQSLERTLNENYIVIIAKSPSDLIVEGNALNHCVGRMNYDRKFAREETLIFFVREKTSPTTPLVTLEYSPSMHKVLQCYGERDTKPNQEILDFVYKKWLPYVNRKIRKVA